MSEDYTVEQVMKKYDIGRTWLYKLLARGTLHAHKVGRRTFISAVDMERWNASRYADKEYESEPDSHDRTTPTSASMVVLASIVVALNAVHPTLSLAVAAIVEHHAALEPKSAESRRLLKFNRVLQELALNARLTP